MDIQLFSSEDRELVPKLVAPGVVKTTLLITGETRPFRFLARHLVLPEPDSSVTAIDLGCSTGETTNVLSKRFKKAIGVDVSHEPVEKGMLQRPSLDLRVFDVLAETDSL